MALPLLLIRSRWNVSVLRSVARLQQRFHSGQSTVELHKIRDHVKSGNGNVLFSPYHVQNCVVGTSFSEAVIRPTCCLVNSQGEFKNPELITEKQALSGEYNTYGIEFSTLFSEGFNRLEDFDEGKAKGVQSYLYGLLHPLRQFLENIDYHSKCIRMLLRDVGTKLDRVTETEVAILLAVHLFSNLVDRSDVKTPSFPKMPVPYFVSNSSSGSVYCPCGCGRIVIYGNTGIGTPALYYGRPDIMVFPSGSVCGIAVPKSKDQSYKAKHLAHEDEKQIVEVKDNYTALKNRKNVSLITAQALTFAYYQKMFQHQYRNEPIHLPHVSLIPTVAICKNYFDIYMYDFENDILLKNRDGPIPLWNEDDPDERTATLNCSSVFILWMTVNHLTFRPRFSKSAVDLMGRSCGFQRQLSEDRLQEIESTIAVGKHFKIPSSEKVIDKAPIK